MILNVNCHKVYRGIKNEIQLHFCGKNNIILGFQVSLVNCVCLFQFVNGDSTDSVDKRIKEVRSP